VTVVFVARVRRATNVPLVSKRGTAPDLAPPKHRPGKVLSVAGAASRNHGRVQCRPELTAALLRLSTNRNAG
jgi:hypothetical protein